MTTFPALIPSTRTYIPGEYPITPHPLLSGSEIRVRHSNTVLGVRLRLTFTAVSSADVVAVRNHYNGRQGGFLPFAIPVQLLSGVTTPADFTPAGHQWVYASRPSVVDVPIAGDTPTNRHDLVVELVTVPPENTIVSGARITVRATVRGGSAQLGAYIESFASVVGGEATAPSAGAAITVEAFVVGGAATGATIDVAAITYSQSSVYFANSAATNAGMTNGSASETLETGTDGDRNASNEEWIRMDLGNVYPVTKVFIGTTTDCLAGDWGTTSNWTNGTDLQYSSDGISWTTERTLSGLTAGAVNELAVSFSARYVRIFYPEQSFIAVTEFYATSS
jgi:hypothetical protein